MSIINIGSTFTDGKLIASINDIDSKAALTLSDSKKYTNDEIAKIIGTAPGTLDTLHELAEALGNDPNFAATITTSIGKKADKTDVYTKTNLSITGQSQIHWGNLTNVPSFAASSHTHTIAQVTGLQTLLDAKETPAGAQAKVDAHNALKTNPHSVTKAQVGLSAVDNIQQATKVEFDSHVGDATHVTTLEKAKWDGKAESSHVHTIAEVTGLQADLNSKETPAGAQTKATKALTDSKIYTDQKVSNLVGTAPEALDTLQEFAAALGNDPNFATTIATQIGEKASTVALNSHAGNRSNPHGVTKAQIGLTAVDNIQQATKVEFNSHNLDATRHITAAERLAWNTKAGSDHTHDVGDISGFNAALASKETPEGAQAKVDAHEAKKTNPHGVTKAQVGLSAVDNLKQATKTEFDSHTLDSVSHITAGERNGWNAKETTAGAQAKVNAHATLKTNPHDVTKAQVGLGSVDNIQQATKAEFNSHNLDSTRHITAAERTKWNSAEGNSVSKSGDTMTGTLVATKGVTVGNVSGGYQMVYDATTESLDFVFA